MILVRAKHTAQGPDAVGTRPSASCCLLPAPLSPGVLSSGTSRPGPPPLTASPSQECTTFELCNDDSLKFHLGLLGDEEETT